MHNKKISVKDRIFIYYMIFFSILSLLEVLINLSYRMGADFNYKWMLIFFASVILMFIDIRTDKKTIVQRITVYISVLLLIPFAWLDSAGIHSSGIIYSFLILIMINYFTNGFERVIVNLLFIAVNLILIYLSFMHPEVFKTATLKMQLINWMVSVPIVFIFSSFQIALIERAYESERQKSEKNTLILKEKSLRDSLTGLYNREHITENWPKLINIHRRKNDYISMIMFDLDFFKNYNDFYGHNQGDLCLTAFSNILKECMDREFDFAYRIGGEEFLVILGQTDESGAVNVAAKVIEALKNASIPHERSAVDDVVTVTAGITSFIVDDMEKDFKLIFDEADKALYKGKENGRNRIICYSQMK